MGQDGRVGQEPEAIEGAGVRELSRLFATIVQQSNDAIAVADEKGVITQWNRAATELYGYTAREAIGRDYGFLTSEPGGISQLSPAGRNGHPVNQFETVHQRKDGRLVEVSVTLSPIVLDDGTLLGTVSLARDISAMVRAQEAMRESERRMNEAQSLAHVGSWDWDLALEFPSWSDELSRIYGYPLGHLPTGGDLLACVHPEDRERLEQAIASAKLGVGNDIEYRIQLDDEEVRHVHARHHTRLDEHGEPIGVHGVVQDVTERRRYEAELERLATHDALTGLPNRRTFDSRIALEMARCRRDGLIFSLAVLDIDNFKRVNDTFGHQVGDRVLSLVGEVFGAEARADELVSRVGGEEFAWILHGAYPEQAKVAVERARARVASTDFGDAGTITMSAGICALAADMDAVDLYRAADLALLEAKRAGRDRVVVTPLGSMPSRARI